MKLEELIGHSHGEIDEILSAPEPYSTFEDYISFKVLLIRRIEFEKDRLDFKSEAYVLKEGEVFYFERDVGEFSQLKKGYQELSMQLEGFYKNNQKIISAYSGQIEQLEEYLFDRSLPSVFMDIWFDIKKDLSKLENYYYRNGIVYHEFLRKSDGLFGKFADEFKDIEDSIQFQSSNISTLKSRLDAIHHYFDSIRGDRLNKTLLTLTVISGVFLPLNLIVGFFGINTPGLFFVDDPQGSYKVLLLISGVFLVCVVGIQIIRLIDRYVLRFILGRYDFYKNISARFDELSDRLRGK